MLFMVSCLNSANSRQMRCPAIFQNIKLLKHLKGRMLVILTVKKEHKLANLVEIKRNQEKSGT